MRRFARWGGVAGLLVAMTGTIPVHGHDNPDNKLVSFRKSGAWEIWCLDIGGTGQIECDLNIVLNYVPNPNFRGMIPRLYIGEDGLPYVRIDYETQTTFSRGFIQVDEAAPFSLGACERPCLIEGDRAHQLVALMVNGKKATIRFHDYFVEAFDVPIDLRGFAEGVELLAEIQAEFR